MKDFKWILFVFKLYCSINFILQATMIITINENNLGEYVTPQETFQTYCYYGDSLFRLQQYRKAESIFKKYVFFLMNLFVLI